MYLILISYETDSLELHVLDLNQLNPGTYLYVVALLARGGAQQQRPLHLRCMHGGFIITS